ncbi:DMT family transporter [Streptomyces xinghaiensis]|uniref:DMT family transporter n=1 Tax=Streptomyces xinghaiensis TaxID=1038928 RepID=UPI0037A6BB8B
MGWGVAAALVANVLYSTGFVLEKRALAGMPPLSAARPGRALLLLAGRPLWICGAMALALGFAAQLAVYRTLPIAAAQGLFLSGLVLLLVLSSVVLGERPSGRERRAVAVIGLALVMVVASLYGAGEEISRSAPAGVLLGLCVPTLAAGLLLYTAAERRARRRHRQPTTGVAYAVAVGLLYGVSSLAIKGVSGHLDTSDLPGSVPALLASPYPYLLLFTGVSGLVLSQTALQRCRASLIVPVCSTVTCVFAIVSGTIAFDEPLPDDPLRLVLRLGGTVLALTVLLTLPRHDADTDTSEGTRP